MLDTSGRGPQPAGPAVRTCAALPGPCIGLVVVHSLPSRLLAERGPVLGVPPIHRRNAERPARLALPSRIGDRIVGLVYLTGSREGIGRRGEVAAEATDVHAPQIGLRLTAGDPLGHDLSDSTRARHSMRAESGGDEEAAHGRLPQTKFAVRRE